MERYQLYNCGDCAFYSIIESRCEANNCYVKHNIPACSVFQSRCSFEFSKRRKRSMPKKASLYDIITEADKKRDEIVLCLLGSPGIGKTQSVYEWAKDHGRNVVEIIASQILPNEVSGITMPVESTHSMEIYDHARLSSLKDGDILFFDELLQAAPTTLSACLTLIQERRLMSGKELPDILIIAAANNIASATMIPLSIRQRFLFYNCKWNKDEWKEYIKENLGVIVDNELIKLIKDDGSDYNVLTPRTATKLIEWFQTADEDVVWSAVSNMFGDYVADQLQATSKRVESKSVNDQIVDAVAEFYRKRSMFDFTEKTKIPKSVKLTSYEEPSDEEIKPEVSYVTIEEMRDCNPNELLEILQSLPDWDSISRELSRIEAE